MASKLWGKTITLDSSSTSNKYSAYQVVTCLSSDFFALIIINMSDYITVLRVVRKWLSNAVYTCAYFWNFIFYLKIDSTLFFSSLSWFLLHQFVRVGKYAFFFKFMVMSFFLLLCKVTIITNKFWFKTCLIFIDIMFFLERFLMFVLILQ